MIITTQTDDVLDLLCARYLGHCNTVATILHNNPVLAGLDAQGLPAGILIDLGDVPVVKSTTEPALDTDAVFLWD